MRAEEVETSRRKMLRLGAAGVSALLATLPSGRVRAFRAEGLAPEDALAWRDQCQPDRFHAGTLDEAVAKLRAAGVRFDEQRLRATLVCPICGCPILTAARQ